MPKNLRPWLPYVLAFVDDPSGDAGGSGENEQGDGAGPFKKAEASFTQADVDKAVRERLAREKAKYADHEDLKAKAAELDQIKAAQKTAEERAAEALAQAQRAAAAAAAEVLRYRAAAENGITSPDDIDLIGSGEQDVVEARAKRVGALLAAERELAAIKEQQAQRVPETGRPRPVLRPGATPVDESARAGSVDAAREAALRRGRATTTPSGIGNDK